MIYQDFTIPPLEKIYLEKTSAEKRKKYGQIFTPAHIARFMLHWITDGVKHGKLLDPALGCGIFFRELRNLSKTKNYHLTGYELDSELANFTLEAFAALQLKLTCRREDFLLTEETELYDGIICNPPYIHFQDNNSSLALIQKFNQCYGLELNGFSNIYALFLIKALTLLKPGGRAAFIIPSEFLNADYGTEIKKMFLKQKMLAHLLVFDPKIQLFPGFLTTSAILLFTNSKVQNLQIFNIKDLKDLQKAEKYLYQVSAKSHLKVRSSLNLINNPSIKVYTYNTLNPTVKWKTYYANLKINLHLAEKKYLTPFSKFANFRRGIATGANEFFTLSLADCLRENLADLYLSPCITRANQVKQNIFGAEELRELIETGKKVFLLNLSGQKLDSAVTAYLLKGETTGFHLRYLTRNRKPWFVMEKSTPADFWVKTFGREKAVFIENKTKALNLTCFHGIYLNPLGQSYRKAIFLYLQTDLAKEIFEGQKRDYGTGLGKFEPNDIKNALVLDFSRLASPDLAKIDRLYDEYLAISRNNEQVCQEIVNTCQKIICHYWEK